MAVDDKDLKKLIAKLAEARKNLKDMSKSFDAMGDLAKQTAALKKNTAAKEKEEEEDDKLEDKIAELSQATVDSLSTLGGAAQKIRESRDDFTSLDPAIKIAGSAVGALGKGAGKVVSGIGDVVSAASWLGGPMVKAVGTGVGMGLNALGDFMDKNAKQVAELGVQYAQFATGEMQRVFTAFQEIGTVGALGAEGVSALYNDAIKASVDVAAYSKIVKAGGQNFAMLGGTTEKGVKLYAQVNEQTKALKDKYLALGMSYEETAEMQAKGIERARMMGAVDANNVSSLVNASELYVKQLNDISRLTGMSRQQANSVLEKQQANTRFLAAQQEQVDKDGNKTIADRMSNVAAYFTGKGGDSLGGAIMDSMSGVATESGRKLQYMTGGASQKLAMQLKAGEISEEQYIQGIQDALDKTMKTFDPETIAKNMGTDKTMAGYEQLMLEARNITTGQKLTAAEITANKEAVAKNTVVTDKTTENMVDAQKSLRDMSLQFDRIVKDKVFPTASASIEKFADTIDEFVSKATGKESTRAQKKAQQKAAGGSTPSTATTGESPAAPVSGDGAPDLAPVTSKSGKSTKVGKHSQAAFQGIIDWLEGQGYKINSLGGYVDRDVRGKPGVKSAHARGAAIDINPGQNPLGSTLVTDMPAGVGAAAASLGLGWGGNWTSRKDAMHFSSQTNEGGKIVKAAEGGIFSGASDGYRAILHGTEAVVPLPDGKSLPVAGPKTASTANNLKQDYSVMLPNGRSIPLNMPKMQQGDPNQAQKAQILAEQNAIIDQMIYYAKQSHQSGKKLVAYKNN